MNAEITCGLTRDVVQLVRVLVDLYRSQLPQCHFELISLLFNPSCLTLHQVLWQKQQRRRWRRRSSPSSGQSDDFEDVGLWRLLPDPSSCVAASAVRRLAHARATPSPWRPGRGAAAHPWRQEAGLGTCWMLVAREGCDVDVFHEKYIMHPCLWRSWSGCASFHVFQNTWIFLGL